jgi:CRP-like cAMP-binding protein
VGEFRGAFALSDTLRTHFLRYANTFAIQIAHTAAANGRANLEQRLARLILMSRDRLRDDDVPLTHEFMATMLGVRRAGVTETVGALMRRRFIRQERRGALVIVDRKGPEKIAGRFYGVPEREYARLMTGE